METTPAEAAAGSTEPDGSAVGTAAAPETAPRPRGRLRVFLGATPGSGKTYAMLREAHERHDEGHDVVVGFVETHGRLRTAAALEGLEVLPRVCRTYRGRAMEEMDLDAVLARHPGIVLVDELAHTNLPGMRKEKRWQDVEEIRANGIDVYTTVNVQAVESVKDLVENITGIPVRETVPDMVLDGADEIQFIDISPEALRKRMRHGNIYAPEKVDIALANFFRPGNLAALREIGLRMLAQTMGRATGAVMGAPQDVLVAISGRPTSEALIRRGARMARRFGGFCTVLRVDDPPDDISPESARRLQKLSEELQCRYAEHSGDDVSEIVVSAAHEFAVQHVVVGEAAGGGLMGRFRKGLVDRLIEELPDVSLHVIARQRDRQPVPPPPTGMVATGAITEAAVRSAGQRGTLRLYLGYASGTGITTTMLEEARRRGSRGADVVVAAVLTEGHRSAVASLEGLDVLGGPDGPGAHGVLDVDALLERRPRVAFVDGLAAPATDGEPMAAHLERILDAGINVVATVHLADLRRARESLADRLGPVGEAEQLIDDDVLALADEIELVDVTPSVLLERIRRGDVVPADEIESAVAGRFRPEVLAALREVAFRVIAEHTDRRLVEYMRERSIDAPWEARPRVMTCVPARDGMDWLIRRSAQLSRAIDGDLHVVTVRDRSRSDDEKRTLGAYAALTHELGAEFVTIYGGDVAKALAEYGRRILATEIIVTRGPGRGLRRSTLRSLIRTLSDVDIHVLAVTEG